MDINKAIRKQKKSFIKFLLSMCFIFFLLPVVLFITKKSDLFFILYLCVVETLILIAVLVGWNNELLKFGLDRYRIKVKYGITGSTLNIACDKISVVHIEGTGKQVQIVILSTSKFRSKLPKPMDINFLQAHPEVAYHYYRIKKLHPEEDYFYVIISKGGYQKYKLLIEIYKTCVNSFFTEEAIEKIKEYR